MVIIDVYSDDSGGGIPPFMINYTTDDAEKINYYWTKSGGTYIVDPLPNSQALVYQFEHIDKRYKRKFFKDDYPLTIKMSYTEYKQDIWKECLNDYFKDIYKRYNKNTI